MKEWLHLASLTTKPLPTPNRPYLRAFLLVVLASAIQLALIDIAPVFAFYYVAVVLGAVYGGTRSAVTATLLACASSFFVFEHIPLHGRLLAIALLVGVASLLTAIVSRLHRVARQLDESQRRFSDILAKVQLLAQMLDREGRILYCNRHLLTVTGWRSEELIGRNVFDALIPPENVAGLKKVHEALLRDDPAAWHVETEILMKDGTRRLVRWSSTVLRNADGVIIGTASIGHDVTDERRAEFANKLLASVVESTDDALIVTSLDGRVTSWNAAAERLFGYPAAEIVGQPIFLLSPADRLDESKINLDRIVRGERIEQLETVRLGRDGRPIDISVTISPLRNEEGRIIGSSSIARDIGHRKAAELALRELSHQLFVAEELERGRIAKELHDSTAQNLIAVMMSLENIKEFVAPRSSKHAGQLEDCLAILESSTHDIRTLSYLLHPARFEEGGLAAALQHYIVGFAERTHIAARFEVPPDFQRLSSEIEMVLFRLVQEALGNIHRHAHAKSAVVRLSRNATRATLEVGDDGCGMPIGPNGEPLKTGVGIAGMRERMRQIGGSFEIESGPHGTKIRVTAPVTKKAE